MGREGQKRNPKRRIQHQADPEYLEKLIKQVHYSGSPYHKKNPGDFGLNPPSQPRLKKSDCGVAGIFTLREANLLLRAGIRKGLISNRVINGYPVNIWSVTDSGVALEGQQDSPGSGTYHGYPLLKDDPFRMVVLEAWKRK